MNKKVAFLCLLLAQEVSANCSLQDQLSSFANEQKNIISNTRFFISFALTTAGISWLSKFEVAKARLAGPLMEQFVKDTLKAAGYSAKQIDQVRVIMSNNGIRTDEPNSNNCIKINLTDEQLIEAIKLEDRENAHILLNGDEYLSMKKRYPQLAEQDLLLKLASRWAVLTEDTISLLKWDIIHQMVRTSRSSFIELLPIAIAGAYGCSYIRVHKDDKYKGFFQDRLVRAIAMPVVVGGLTLLYRIKRVIPSEIREVQRRCKDQQTITTQQRLAVLNV